MDGARAWARKVVPRVVRQVPVLRALHRSARRLEQIVQQRRPDVLICETYADAHVLTKSPVRETVYGAPDPLPSDQVQRFGLPRPV